MSYDDQRILGGLDWNVAGRYHDAVKLGYAKNDHIFQTNNKKVWNYITKFAEFNRFTNSPVANYCLLYTSQMENLK